MKNKYCVYTICDKNYKKRDFTSLAEAEAEIREHIKKDEGVLLKKDGQMFGCYCLRNGKLWLKRVEEDI